MIIYDKQLKDLMPNSVVAQDVEMSVDILR